MQPQGTHGAHLVRFTNKDTHRTRLVFITKDTHTGTHPVMFTTKDTHTGPSRPPNTC